MDGEYAGGVSRAPHHRVHLGRPGLLRQGQRAELGVLAPLEGAPGRARAPLRAGPAADLSGQVDRRDVHDPRLHPRVEGPHADGQPIPEAQPYRLGRQAVPDQGRDGVEHGGELLLGDGYAGPAVHQAPLGALLGLPGVVAELRQVAPRARRLVAPAQVRPAVEQRADARGEVRAQVGAGRQPAQPARAAPALLGAAPAHVPEAPAPVVVGALAGRPDRLRPARAPVAVGLHLPRHRRRAHLEAPGYRRGAEARLDPLLDDAPVVVIQMAPWSLRHGNRLSS